jgi:hypothetical protein
MEKHELDSIFEKTYIELSDSEKSEMSDLFQNEDEFNQLKYIFNQISNEVDKRKSLEIEPKAEIKSNLDNLFHQKYQNTGVLWYNALSVFFINPEKKWHAQNLTRIAAIAILALLMIPFMNSTKIEDNGVLTAKNEIKTEGKKEKEKIENKIVNDDNSLENESNVENKLSTEKEFKQTFDASPAEIVRNNQTFGSSLASEDFDNLSAKEKPTSDVFLAESSSLSMHPDGVFIEREEKNKESTNFSLQANLNFLDLLTPTF